jgi:hypothetical protein
VVFEPLQSNITETRNLAKNLVAHGIEEGLALRHAAPADEYRRVLLVLRRPREDRAVDQRRHIPGVYAAIGRDVIRAAVVTDDIVEYRGQRIGVELIQQASSWGGDAGPKRL